MQYEINLIMVDGLYKALVIDLDKASDRLVGIFDGVTKDEAYSLASIYIANKRVELCH